MRRIIVAASLCAFAVTCSVSWADQDKEPTLRSIYKAKYRQVESKFGNGAAGRHIVKDGINGKQGDRPARDGEIARSIRTMRSMLAPAPVQAQPTGSDLTASAYSSPTPAPTSYSGNGNYSIPTSIVNCESGGSYTAENPSGAYGAYQLMPEHWSHLGHKPSPAEQDQIAAKLWNGGAGRSNWVC